MAQKKPFHQEFAEQIIEDLKAGSAPWIKPWEPGEQHPPFNPISGTVYKGINRVMLSRDGFNDPRFLTLKQANEEGWRIKKGSKSRPVVYWQFSKEESVLDDKGKPVLDQDGNPQKQTVQLDRPRVHFARVFHANDVEGISPWEGREITWDASERAETILTNSQAVLNHDQRDRAFYRPSTDSIHLPPKEAFDAADKYYSTALHELGHWTGHESRFDREHGPFGSEVYAKEELRAEIGSWMLGGELGIGHDPGQHMAYVASWIKVLEQDPFEIVRACRDAEQIKEYCMGLEKGKVLDGKEQKSGHQQSASREPARTAKDKTYLAVPYNQKDAANKAGARWDRKARLWFAPKGADMAGLAQWVPEKQPAHTPAMSPEREFAEVLREVGLDLQGELPLMDGVLRRVPLIDGKPGSRDGAYKGHLDGHPAGFYQNHKTGDKGTWKATNHKMTIEEKAQLKVEAERKHRQRQKALAEQHKQAAKKAFGRWKNAPGWAHQDQPYLAAKGVYGYGVKVSSRGDLLIPGRDVNGFIHTLQSVSKEGKFFVRGSQKTGTFHTIDPDKSLANPQTPILIAEGYATAASVHMATGMPVHAAFDAGNLGHAAVALHQKYPDRQFVILADDDHGQPGNPGKAKAEIAAKAVSGLVVVPEFSAREKQEGRTDFNDLHAARGLDAVRKQVAPVLEKIRGREFERQDGLAMNL